MKERKEGDVIFWAESVTSARATMSEVTRTGWFDNARNQAVTEQIVKEARYRNAAMTNDFAAELAELEAEEEAERDRIELELGKTKRPGVVGGVVGGVPASPGPSTDPTTLTMWQKDNAISNEIGRSLWKNANVRYDPSTMNVNTHYKTDFQWLEDEVELPDKKHFRKRDGFTAYVEAAARRNVK